MSLLDKPTDPAPGEQDPHRQGAKRSKEARAARAAERAAAKAGGAATEPKRPKAPRSPRQHKSGEGGRGRGTTTSTAVNLLSPWVLEELKVHHLRQRFIVGAVALLVVLGLATGAMRLHLGNVEQELADEESLSAGLQSQINELADVKRYVGEVGVRTMDVEDAMATDVAMSEVMRALEEALPQGAAYDGITVTMPVAELLSGDPLSPAAAAPTCPGPDPFNTKPVVGCIEFSGTALTRADVSLLVQALADANLFVEPFIPSSTIGVSAENVDSVDFTGSVGISEKALTKRYHDLDGSDADTAGTDQTGADQTGADQTGAAGETESDGS